MNSRSYVSPEEYYRLRPSGEATPEELERAGYEVDSLVFGRVRSCGGIDALREKPRELIVRAVCLHADFLHEYGEALENPISSYGINGVSVSFDRSQMVSYNGVTTRRGIYALLQESGFTYRGMDWRPS